MAISEEDFMDLLTYGEAAIDLGMVGHSGSQRSLSRSGCM